ncbi:hypothetical protein RCL1_004535 [Eukaryota sp. TZLM3-RCL]
MDLDSASHFNSECPSYHDFENAHYRWILLLLALEYAVVGIVTTIEFFKATVVQKHKLFSFKSLFLLTAVFVMFIRAFPLVNNSTLDRAFNIIFICVEAPLFLQFVLLVLLVLFLFRAFYFLKSHSIKIFLPSALLCLFMIFAGTIAISHYADSQPDTQDGYEKAMRIVSLFNSFGFGCLFLLLSILGHRVYSALSSLAMTSTLRGRINAFRRIIILYSTVQLFRSIWSIFRFFDWNYFQRLMEEWSVDYSSQHYFFIATLLWYNLVEIIPCLCVIFALEKVFPHRGVSSGYVFLP